MATQEEVEEYSAAQQAVVVLAAAELADYMATEPDTGEMADVFGAIVKTFGEMSAGLAADFYDEMRANSRKARGKFEATPSDPASDEWIQAVVRIAQRPRLDFPTGTTDLDQDHDDLPDVDDFEPAPEPEPQSRSDQEPEPVDVAESEDEDEPEDIPEREPTNEEIAAELGRKIQRMIQQAGRDTIADNSERDPAKARWARVPTGPVTCAFCLVMASRGAVYTTRAAAVSVIGRRGRTRGKRSLGESYHDACDCQAVPIWDEDEDYPEHYKPDELYQQYTDARDAVRSGDLKTILAELRRQQGLR